MLCGAEKDGENASLTGSLLRLLQILEKIDSISGNEAANSAARIDGYGDCPVGAKHKPGRLQVERIFVKGRSNRFCHFMSVKAIQHRESEPVPFDGLLRLLKRIDRERDDLGSQLIQLLLRSLKVQ